MIACCFYCGGRLWSHSSIPQVIASRHLLGQTATEVRRLIVAGKHL